MRQTVQLFFFLHITFSRTCFVCPSLVSWQQGADMFKAWEKKGVCQLQKCKTQIQWPAQKITCNKKKILVLNEIVFPLTVFVSWEKEKERDCFVCVQNSFFEGSTWRKVPLEDWPEKKTFWCVKVTFTAAYWCRLLDVYMDRIHEKKIVQPQGNSRKKVGSFKRDSWNNFFILSRKVINAPYSLSVTISFPLFH